MFYGLIALLTRALRMDARQLRNHLFRFAFVGFIYVCLLMATFQSAFLGAPGLNFFSQIAWLNALFITCAGVGFFSSAITEEKEEETIGLLQMAGLNHLGILLGKSTSRLIQVMLLLVVQFPFMLLAVTLGGVTTLQIAAAYVDLLAYTVLLANVALVCSVIFQRGGTAAGVTTLLLIIHALSPFIATLGLRDLRLAGWVKTVWWQSWILTSLEWVEESCVFQQLVEVMTTGFSKPLMSRQVISNCGAGFFSFFLAWLLFGPVINNAAPGGVSRGIVLKSTNRLKFLSPGRCWANPFVWKDFQFIGGGYTFFLGKTFAYVGFYLATEAVAVYPTNWFAMTPNDVLPVYCSTMGAILILEACLSASRIFHDEIRMHTMSSLLMLPRSIPYIGYSKAAGCLLGLLPATSCFVFGVLHMPAIARSDRLLFLIDPRVWAIVMMFLIFLHLIALLSLFVKWGALPAAFFLMGPVSSCCPVWTLMSFFSDPNRIVNSWGVLPATITVWILTGLVCFVFQMMIAARLQDLSTR